MSRESADNPQSDAIGERLYRLGRIHLWGRRRTQRPPLTGDEAVWARLELERGGANLHLVLGAYAGFLAGIPAAALVAMAMVGPDVLIDELLRHGAKIAWVMVVWLFPAAIGLALCLRGPHQKWLWSLSPAPRRTAAEIARQQRALQWSIAIVLGALGLAFILTVVDRPPMLSMAGLAASGGALAAGLRWRTGRELMCHRCWYPVEGPPAQWTRCSECGSELKELLAVVRGYDIRRLWLAALALVAWIGCVWTLADMLAI